MGKSKINKHLRPVDTEAGTEFGNMVRHDHRSTTCQNIEYISSLINDSCISLAPWKLKQMIPRNITTTNEHYRRSLLSVLLEARFRGNIPDFGLSKEHPEEIVFVLPN